MPFAIFKKSRNALVARKVPVSYKRTRKFAKRNPPPQIPDFPFHKMFGRQPVPSYAFKDFNYSTNYTLTSAGASAFGVEQIFRLNSCYDPDFSGAGHQPYGWDQFTTSLYSAFRVDRCTLDLEFINTSTAELVAGVQISSSLDTVQLAGTSLIGAQERFNCWTANVPTTGAQRVRMVQTFPMHMVEGLTQAEYASNPYYHGTRTTDPALCNYVRIAIADYAGGAGGISMQLRVNITYHTKLFKRITLGMS